jgi:hypothetical protein
MLGIFSPGQKLFFFRHFSPFFSHVAQAPDKSGQVMLLQKRKN